MSVYQSQLTPNFKPIGPHTANASIATATTIPRVNIRPNEQASKIQMQADNQNIRYTIDGSIPTPTFGFRITAGTSIGFTLADLAVLIVIQEAATATLQYQWGE